MSVATLSNSAIHFERHREDVYRWALRLVGRHDDALDVAQDVFVKWLEISRRAGPAPANPRAWLRRVTINRAIDLLRLRHADALDDADDRSLAIGPGEQTLEIQEQRRQIAAALDQLTEAQRSVLIAKVFDGLTFARIAAEHDLAVPTVKTHYLRAVMALREILERTQHLERNR